MKLPYFALIAFISINGSYSIAEIYKYKNSKGEWEYSQTPPEDRHIKPTGIQTEYSTAPKFIPKPVKKSPEPEGPTVISIDDGGRFDRECTTAGNGYMTMSNGLDGMQSQLWKRCRGMR